MAYTDLPSKSSTDTFSSTDWAAIKANFEASAPHVITTAGDLIAASGSQALGRLAVGTHRQVLQANSAETLGVEWSGCIGVYCTTDSITIPTATVTEVPFFTELYDNGDFHATSPTTDAHWLTTPFAGVYLISWSAIFPAGSGDFYASCYYSVPVTGNERNPPSGVAATPVAMSMVYRLNASYPVNLNLYQTSGGDVTVTNIRFGMVLLR